MNLKEIKDAARKAFRDQQSQDTEGGVPDAISFCAGFLAGARHLQNAYETLNAHDEMLIATVDKLKEENKKLVEALKFYAKKSNWILSPLDHISLSSKCENDLGDLARQILKEIGEE